MLVSGCGSGTSAVTPAPTPTPTPTPTPVAAPTASIAQTSLKFGSTSVGSAAVPQLDLLLSNSGTVAFTGLSISGTNASSFAASSNCPASLPAGASCTITVTFTPGTAGTLSATLSVADSASGAPQTVALTGTGVALTPAATFSATSIIFAGSPVGTPASSQTVTVSNTGSASLTLSSIALTQTSSAFSLAGTCAAATVLAPGASCTLVVSFTAMGMLQQTGSILVTDNAAGSPTSISLSGNTGLPLTALVQAGTQPVVGATVQLLAAGTTGNGSAPTVLSTTTITTDATGTATLPGFYNCPTSSSELYLISRGGAVGSSGANAGLVLMSAIGPCSQVTSGMKFYLNEATTVGSVFALAPFYTAGGLIGSSATNTIGITNAFNSAAELVSMTTGSAPGSTLPAGNVTSPAPRINSLANLLNGCAVKPSSCSGLFALTSGSATAPTNTLDAIYNIVHSPANQVPALYTASQASSAFTPALTAQPADWTLFLTISGGGLAGNGPSGLGVDAAGNVWVATYFSDASKFTALGAPVFPNGVTGAGLNNSYGLAMDANSNVWIPNEQPNTGASTGSVSELSDAGVSLAGDVGFTQGGIYYAISDAVDPNGTVWVVDYGNSRLTLLNSAGVPLPFSDNYVPFLAFPTAVVVDGNHFGWIANQGANTVTKISPDGATAVNYTCCNEPSGIAIDQGNNVWVTNFLGSSVSLVSNTGAVISNGTYTGNGGINHPQGIAVDGAGNIWVANFRAAYLSELTGVASSSPGTSLTPSTGYGADAQLLEAYAIAVDASGNVWVSNFGSDTITKFIGLATPIKTPLSGLPQVP